MITLRAGQLKMNYDKGFLRHISYGKDEVLRMLYFALRDENWGTYTPLIENEDFAIQADSFVVRYDCFHERAGKRIFHWQASLKGNKDGTIIFEIHGKALQEVLKNRAGFCILHPVKGVSGQPCELIHADGAVANSKFPEFVAPHTPFKNLQGIRWRAGGYPFSLQFEGDRFETEDHRNWTDASYKTYCTPLELPFPVRLGVGASISQKVTFKPESALPALHSGDDGIRIAVTNDRFALPFLGIGASTESEALNPDAVQSLKALSLSHYKIDIYPQKTDWVSRFSKDCENAHALHIPIEATLHVSENYELESQAFVLLCKQNNIRPQYLILLQEGKLATSQKVVHLAKSIKEQLPGVLIGAGTDYHFTELNRNRFDSDGLDFISFTIHPQEHAFDNLSLIENIEAQAEVVRSARHIYPGLPIHISPLTIKKRFNPVATNPAARILTNAERFDPRLQTAFGAVFTLGSLKSLAISGTKSITLYQSAGNQGIMSEAGEPYPVYNALQEVSSAGYFLRNTTTTHPLEVDALLLEGKNEGKLILFNYTDEPRKAAFLGEVYALDPMQVIAIAFLHQMDQPES